MPSVIVHLGDFGYAFTSSYLQPLDRALARARLRLLFVDGNHEDHVRLAKFPRRPNGLARLTPHIWHLPRGHRWTWAGIRFLAVGGAHSVDRPYRVPGISWWAEEWLTDEQIATAIAGGPADVLVAHDCPTGVTIPGIDDRTTPAPWPAAELARSDEHRRRLRAVVDATRPRVIWHGHYHVAHQQTVDLGYGPVHVSGLDRDDTDLEANVHIVDLADLRDAVDAT